MSTKFLVDNGLHVVLKDGRITGDTHMKACAFGECIKFVSSGPEDGIREYTLGCNIDRITALNSSVISVKGFSQLSSENLLCSTEFNGKIMFDGDDSFSRALTCHLMGGAITFKTACRIRLDTLTVNAVDFGHFYGDLMVVSGSVSGISAKGCIVRGIQKARKDTEITSAYQVGGAFDIEPVPYSVEMALDILYKPTATFSTDTQCACGVERRITMTLAQYVEDRKRRFLSSTPCTCV